MPNPTTNFGWVTPIVGGSTGTWGTLLNALFDELDSDLFGMLPKAGGQMTGEIGVKTDKFDTVDKGAMTGAVSLDCAVARFFYGSIAGNTTLSITNVPATGKAVFLVFELTNPGAFTITWPSGTKWPGGAAPSFTVSGVDVVSLYTRDGGTTWRATRAQAASA